METTDTRNTGQSGIIFAALVTVMFSALCMCDLAHGAPEALTWAVASQDRQRHFEPSQWYNVFYVHTGAVPEAIRGDMESALKMMLCSTSREHVIEAQLPVLVADGLWRIDLRGLGWHWRDWYAVLKDYPYNNGIPLVIDGGWLVVTLADYSSAGTGKTPAGYLLLYGSAGVPKTGDDFMRFWGYGGKTDLHFGLIEAASGVAQNSGSQGPRVRWIENRPVARGYGWATRDVFAATPDSDPLEHPDGRFAHDGEEYIAGVPKMSQRTGARGTLQAYFLALGKDSRLGAGNRIEEASVKLVRDHNEFRGITSIRTSGSCIGCHVPGINPPTLNGLRGFLDGGGKLYSTARQKLALERFHLSDVGKEVKRNQEDYADGVDMATGQTPEEMVASFVKAVAWYDSDVTLAQAAAEHGIAADELRLALGYAESAGFRLGARLSALANGKAMARAHREESFLTVRRAVNLWVSGRSM